MGVVSSVVNSLCFKRLTRTSSDALKKRGLLRLQSSTSFFWKMAHRPVTICAFPGFFFWFWSAAVGWGQESPSPPGPFLSQGSSWAGEGKPRGVPNSPAADLAQRVSPAPSSAETRLFPAPKPVWLQNSPARGKRATIQSCHMLSLVFRDQWLRWDRRNQEGSSFRVASLPLRRRKSRRSEEISG